MAKGAVLWPSLLPEASAADQRVRAARRDSRGRRRPLCVRGNRVSGTVWATDEGGKGHGRGRWERLYRPSSRASRA